MLLILSRLLRIFWGIKDLDWGLAYDTILILLNTNLVFEALGVVCIEFVLLSIPFDTLVVEAVKAHNLLAGPNSTQANCTVEILTRLKEERAIIKAIANCLHLPGILTCILLGRSQDNDIACD